MARRKITLASNLPKPSPPKAGAKEDAVPDRVEFKDAFNKDITDGAGTPSGREPVRRPARYHADPPDPRLDQYGLPTIRPDYVTDAERTSPAFNASRQAARDCPSCGGNGYVREGFPSRNGNIIRTAVPCRVDDCEMGIIARGMFALKTRVARGH